ncbi:MAG: hypothetical protein K2R98_19330 [Gemmataceae bacterium]|nr:hypothetical protein [Gemmataceae bacterium]
MSVNMRRMVEKRIARRLILDAIQAGYSININNGGDSWELPTPSVKVTDILKAMFATDDEHLIFYKDGKRAGWVWFVYGNDGWDVISDYSMNLEHIMAGANKVSEHYQ